jgi:hypothetical protein
MPREEEEVDEGSGEDPADDAQPEATTKRATKAPVTCVHSN